MHGWQYRESTFVYESPDVTVILDQYTGPPVAAPAHRPDLAAVLPGLSPFLLWEWTQYRVTVSPPLPGLILQVGDQIVPPVAQGVYLFRYENALGASRIRLDGAPIPDLHVEVLSHKLAGDSLANYPRLYRTMVQQIIEGLLTLPFHIAGTTAHATRPQSGPMSPVFTLHFLRHHGHTITTALEIIGVSPHRVLTREELVRPVAMATRLDSAALRWGLTHPDSWANADQHNGWFRLHGQAILPERLLQERAEETFDTHENRFVRHFLLSLRQAVDGALAVLERYGGRQNGQEASGTQRTGLWNEVTALAHRLDEALAWPWWDEVGELIHLPEQSTVLHGKDGYRELWTLYPEFLLGRSPFGYSLDRAIAARDVATLYEYWCFFQLISLVAALKPALHPARLEVRLDETGGFDYKTTACFGKGNWRLVFNLPARGGRGSYSLGLRPDFTLIGPAGTVLVLDAKFRMDAPRPELDDPAWAEASPQNEDLYKMHTYRDALGVRAAVALYPGNQTVFYDRRTWQRRTDLTLDDLIFGEFEGVGALPLRPEGGTQPCAIS